MDDSGCSNREFCKWLRSLGWEDEGWITDKGVYWPCTQDLKHSMVAASVLDSNEEDAEAAADRMGWLRISDYGDRTAAKKLNKKQLNILWDFCQHHGSDYEEVLANIQYL